MFITDQFLLTTDAARELYVRYAEHQPIIDYHNHLDPDLIAGDYQYRSLAEIWLGGDHYKWRAMRANGVDETFITGDAPDRSKFIKWAETVPYTMRNPLYHWTHLELKRYFNIDLLLNPDTADTIYHQCSELLRTPEFSVRNLLRRMNVETLCTTDDPADSLDSHLQIAADNFEIKVLPTWRPDKIMAVDNPTAYNAYLNRLGAAADVEIDGFDALLAALRNRQDAFTAVGCRLSDHGVTEFPTADFTDRELASIFRKIRGGYPLNADEQTSFRCGMLYHLARMNHERGWTQQFHIGAIRNNNSRLFNILGPDIGCDSIADYPVAEALSRFLGRLDEEGALTKTILYNLNPKDTEVIATMAYNFNDGSIAGKMQYGAAWWFLDQQDGMEKQLNALSNLGLLSRFVGMLTDSRSFLSYPRHEYFRRILCNLLGNDIEKGALPAQEMDFIGKMVSDICYRNAKHYFGF